MKVPTTGTYDFPRLILGGEGKYVDKTDLLYQLASPKSDTQFFISRPRRFGKSLMLSTLNHLTDLTMDGRFATLLGYTPDELDGSLRENIEVFAAKNGMDFAAAKKVLLAWYDGYRFSPESEAKVCNPVSLGKALENGILANYWEATGQSTMIVNRIKAAKEIPADLNGLAATRTQLDVCAAETMPLPALLYQGGYLTIKEAIDANFFRLGYRRSARRAGREG